MGADVSTGTLYIKPTSDSPTRAGQINRGLYLASNSDIEENEYLPPIMWRSNDHNTNSSYRNLGSIELQAVSDTGAATTNNHSKMLFGLATGTTSPTQHFSINYNGDLEGTDTAIGSISDIRTKTDIKDYTGPTTGSMSGSTSLELIESLNLKHFKFTGDYGSIKDKWRAGVIAQEVSASAPYIVRTSKHQIDQNWYTEDENGGKVSVTPTGSYEDILNVALGDMIPDMLNAIQDLSQQVKTLKAQISGSSDFNALKTD